MQLRLTNVRGDNLLPVEHTSDFQWWERCYFWDTTAWIRPATWLHFLPSCIAVSSSWSPPCVWMVFMGRGFTSGRQESWSVFSAAVCKIQASKCYIESLPLVPKDKRSCFSLKVKGPLYSCLLIVCLPSGSTTLNWHLETIYSSKSA